jgi:hypothetical protein
MNGIPAMIPRLVKFDDVVTTSVEALVAVKTMTA